MFFSRKSNLLNFKIFLRSNELLKIKKIRNKLIVLLLIGKQLFLLTTEGIKNLTFY